MIYKHLSIYGILELAEAKSLICFGAGKLFQRACETFSDVSFFDKVEMIADNDINKHSFSFQGVEKPVFTLEKCIKNAKKPPIILITVVDFSSIAEQLDTLIELNDVECYIYIYAKEMAKPHKMRNNRSKTEAYKIPKVIHYCWFGGGAIPDDLARYMSSWKRYCPDYEIIRWDESNYDYKKNEYMYNAYINRKWGFASDFARLDIIHTHGGVYLDTDVELIRNIDDLLCDEAFCGFECEKQINFGMGYGAAAGFPLIKGILDIYEEISFFNKDGSFNLTPCPVYQTEYMRSQGLIQNNNTQKILGMMIYPSDVLSPIILGTGVLAATDNTHAIHHYAATWVEGSHKERRDAYIQKNKDFAKRFEVHLQNEGN